MTNKVYKVAGKLIILGGPWAFAAAFAEQTQLQSVSAAASEQITLQRVVIPPPPGPYTSRLGIPSHADRFNRMRQSFNRQVPLPFPAQPMAPSGYQQGGANAAPVYPPQTDASAPSWENENRGAYRPDAYNQAGGVTRAAPAYRYPGRGYPPGPPRGYGYPPAPAGYGYYPVPPPGYRSPWNAPQTQGGTTTAAPATGKSK